MHMEADGGLGKMQTVRALGYATLFIYTTEYFQKPQIYIYGFHLLLKG